METLPTVGLWLDEGSLSNLITANKEAKIMVEGCRRRKLKMQQNVGAQSDLQKTTFQLKCPQRRALTNLEDMIRTNSYSCRNTYQVPILFSRRLLCTACHNIHLCMRFLPEICAWLDTVSLSRLLISYQEYKKTVSLIFKSRGRRLPILWEARETAELPHLDSSLSQGAQADIIKLGQNHDVDSASLTLNTAGQCFSFLNVKDEGMLKAASLKHRKLLQEVTSCKQSLLKPAITHTPSCDDSRIGSESPSFWKITARSSEDDDFSAALHALFVR
jgi:hypothetical protein